uniref:Transmembrane protein n=1 Tax=Globodera rostochiensis TaxID=31243 RepID=A0A914ID04_GLORO
MGKVPPFVVGWLSATLSSRLTSETTEKKQPIVVACSRRKNSDQNRYGLVVVVVSWVYLYFSIVPFWSNVESRLIPPNTKGLSAASKCVRGDDCEHSKSAAQHNQMAKKVPKIRRTDDQRSLFFLPSIIMKKRTQRTAMKTHHRLRKQFLAQWQAVLTTPPVSPAMSLATRPCSGTRSTPGPSTR